MSGKIQLGILFGSRSCEHEVSIISALQLAAMANPFKYEVIPVYITKRGEWFIGGRCGSWKPMSVLTRAKAASPAYSRI